MALFPAHIRTVAHATDETGSVTAKEAACECITDTQLSAADGMSHDTTRNVKSIA